MRSKSLERDQETTVVADLGDRCYKLDYRIGIGSTAETVRLCLWDPCTTEVNESKDHNGFNFLIRQRYISETVFHAVIITFDIGDIKSFKLSIQQYEELLAISKKAEKSEKKFEKSGKNAM